MKLRTVEAEERATLDTVLKRSLSDETAEPVVITRHGKAVAVLIPVDYSDVESISLSLDTQFNALLQASRLSVAEEGAISAEEMDSLFAADGSRKEDEKSA